MIKIPENELSIKKYGCHKCLTCEKYGYDDVYVTHLPTGLEGNAKRSIFGIEGSSEEALEKIKGVLEDPLQLAILDLSNQVEFMKNKPKSEELDDSITRKKARDCAEQLLSYLFSIKNDKDIERATDYVISAIILIIGVEDELQEIISNRDKKSENSLSVKSLMKWFKK